MASVHPSRPGLGLGRLHQKACSLWSVGLGLPCSTLKLPDGVRIEHTRTRIQGITEGAWDSFAGGGKRKPNDTIQGRGANGNLPAQESCSLDLRGYRDFT